MTNVVRLQDNVANGTGITGSGSSNSNLAGISTYNVSSPSTMAWVTDSGAGTGQTVLQLGVSTGTDIARWNLNASNDFLAVSCLLKVPASAAEANAPVMGIRYASGYALKLGFDTTNRPYVIDFANTVKFIATAGTLTAGSWYRFEQLIHGNSTTAGDVQCNVYTPTGTTPVATLTHWTNANLTANTLAAVELGNTSSNAVTFSAANLQFNDGATTEIGPYSTPLSTPSLTLGTTTNPTTVGGSNGSQVVSWSGVANASTYDAYIATNTSPAQSDFTSVATGVTSPYAFTGLTAGSYAFGIKAKP